MALAQQLERDGLPAVLTGVCGLAANSPLAEEIETAWRSESGLH